MNSSCILLMNNSWFIHGPDGRIFYMNNSWVTHGQSGELPFMGYSWIIVPRHGEAIGGNIKILGVRLCVCASVRPCVRPSVTKLVGAITSDFMHRFTQYLTQ